MSLGEKPNKMIGESFWRLLARRTEARLEREQMWDALEPYERPKSLTPLLLLNVAAFYTGVVAAAITEQLHKERHWEKHPGEAIPIMKPVLYMGPYRVRREDFAENAPGQ